MQKQYIGLFGILLLPQVFLASKKAIKTLICITFPLVCIF